MFSFIIPVYNSEQYLNECIESILRIQLNKEIIFVDDGSTDSSSFLCEEFVSNYSCIKYYRKENGGAASARNVGLEKSNGEFIVFVDSDDTLDSKWYEIISRVIDFDTDLFVYGMSFDYYNNGILLKSYKLSSKYNGKKKKEEIEEHFKEYFENNTLSSACNKVFRKEIIDKYDIRFNEVMNLYEDMDFVIQYLTHINSTYFIPDALYHYRLNTDNKHSVNRTSDLHGIRLNLDSLSDTVRLFSKKNSVHSVVSNLYMSFLVSNLMQNEYKKPELSSVLNDYINTDNIDSEELTEYNKSVYELLKKKEYDRLYSMIEWRKAKSRIKKSIKKIIGK